MAFNFVPPAASGASQSSKEATSSSSPAAGGVFGSTTGGGANPSPFSSAAKDSSLFSKTSFGPASQSGDKANPPASFSLGGPKPDSAAASGSNPAPASAFSAAGSLSGGLFGSPTKSSAPSLFGSKTVFGSQGGTSQGQGNLTPASSATSTSNLFSTATSSSLLGKQNDDTSSKPAAATPAKPTTAFFSTTPAGIPPINASKSAGSLLGGNSQKPTTTMSSEGTTSSPAPIFGLPAPSMDKPSSGGSLFGAANQGASSAPGGLFGSGSAAASSSGAPLGSLTAPTGAPDASSATSIFGTTTPAPAATTTTATTTASSSAFPATAAPVSDLFGGKRGAPASDTVETAATTPAASAGGLFGNTQSKSAASTSAPSPSPFTAPASSSSQQAASASAAPVSTPSSASAPAASATDGVFGAKPATESEGLGQGKDKDGGASKTATTQGSSNMLGASTSGPPSQLPRLKNKTMEDIITRWASDLSKYQKEFKEQATVVSTWDRKLVENGEKIQKLYLDTFEAERASHEIERQLAAVEGQQEELELWLNRYESEVQEMFAKQLGPGEQLAGPDQERERTYKLAEKLTQQLDEKSRDLAKMVKEINDISGTLSKGARPEDPLSQIVRVLNAHLTQLQWIDVNASALQAKVKAAQKSSSTLGSHYGGAETDAAESFYRSYMGRW